MNTQAELRVKQQLIEMQFNREQIRSRIREDVDTIEGLEDWVAAAVQALDAYRSRDYTYDSKQKRVEHVRTLDADEVVMEILYRTAEFQDPMELVAVAATIKGIFKMEEEVAAVTTAAEVLAILAPLGAWQIYKETAASTLKFKSLIVLTGPTMQLIELGMFLPPMICKPDTLEGNRDSGYLTYVDSLILGKRNHHNKDICLDVLNKMNGVALSLNADFIEAWPEEPTFEIKDQFQADNWNKFIEQSHKIYQLLLDSGNEFYINHRVDKRGRIYSMAYHVNPQGTSYKKAMIDLAKKEVVDGVPEHLKII